MEYNFNPGEMYIWNEKTYVIKESCPNDVYPKFLVQSPGTINAFWIEGKRKVKEIKPIPLCEAQFIGLGFQKTTKENDIVPEYEILMHGAIKIRFMEVKDGGRDYYYLTNPCMGPIFFEFVHEVQRFLAVFQGAERRANIFKSL
jgi:hypothetical protein